MGLEPSNRSSITGTPSRYSPSRNTSSLPVHTPLMDTSWLRSLRSAQAIEKQAGYRSRSARAGRNTRRIHPYGSGNFAERERLSGVEVAKRCMFRAMTPVQPV